MQVRELDVKFIKFLLNLKAINYLKNKKIIDEDTYDKSRVQIEKIAQS